MILGFEDRKELIITKPICEIVYQCFPVRKALFPTVKGGANVSCHHLPTSDVWLPWLRYYFGATYDGREREGTELLLRRGRNNHPGMGQSQKRNSNLLPPWWCYYSSNTDHLQCHQPPTKDPEHCCTAATKLPVHSLHSR